MLNVKRTFFLTEEEATLQRRITGNRLIDHSSPHFEMEDGTIKWGMVGYLADGSRFHGEKHT